MERGKIIPRLPRKLLKQDTLVDTLEGGTEGSAHAPKEHLHSAFSASGQPNLVAALDIALGALCMMFATALRPDARGARDRLDIAYEDLITSLEVFRDGVPKA